mmetsp:Transcript_25150/g.37601  ORF Transcript_25150/g.37601 Transcript_25150/m.37601 type:complete len:230 (+) Transcript_25150:722-1411(+)
MKSGGGSMRDGWIGSIENEKGSVERGNGGTENPLIETEEIETLIVGEIVIEREVEETGAVAVVVEEQTEIVNVAEMTTTMLCLVLLLQTIMVMVEAVVMLEGEEVGLIHGLPVVVQVLALQVEEVMWNHSDISFRGSAEEWGLKCKKKESNEKMYEVVSRIYDYTMEVDFFNKKSIIGYFFFHIENKNPIIELMKYHIFKSILKRASLFVNMFSGYLLCFFSDGLLYFG